VRHYSDGLLEDNGPFVMAKKDRFFERSTKALQENAERAGPAAGASYTLIGAILLLGGIGYAVDAWQGTSPWFLMAGLLLGIVVGMWELAKVVWRR
jgi:F0F1-type ATP synthase assembly protein I